MRWGYNGWHDWCAPRVEGVPQSTLAETLHFSYKDLDSLEKVLLGHPDEVACVVMMSYEHEAPEPGFLSEVGELAHAHGALFILDEMRSGFRISLGGAQEYFGVQADLSTFSKAMANGYAVSAVVGRADVLELKLGDSLRRKIDAGIARTRFGVVVLSHAFFAKNWSGYELDGLVVREMNGGKQIILPLWHNISKDEIIAQSPSLADKVALQTATSTVDEIAEQIAAVVAEAEDDNSRRRSENGLTGRPTRSS